MGTRADFYIKSFDAIEDDLPIQWLASIAWDGYPSGIHNDVLKSQNYLEYSNRLQEFLSTRDDVTYPKDGWPWPWKTSSLTDFAYLFDCNINKVVVWHGPKQWYAASRYEDEEFYADEVDDLIIEATYTLPDFDTDSPALDSNRSGILIIG